MVSVSQKWIDNQNSKIQAQGFAVVRIIRQDEENEGQYIIETLSSDMLLYQDNCIVTPNSLQDSIYAEQSESGDLWLLCIEPMQVVIDHKKYQIPDRLTASYSQTSIEAEDIYIYLYINNDGEIQISDTEQEKSIKIGKLANDTSVGEVSFAFDENLIHLTNIPRSYIKSLSHNRSFDPMGFNLPSNGLELELYDYENKFRHYYEGYSGEVIKIEVDYGYLYSDGTTELISGGVFHVSKIELDQESVIKFQAIDELENIQEDIDIAPSNGLKEISVTIWQHPIYASTSGNAGTKESALETAMGNNKAGTAEGLNITRDQFSATPTFDNSNISVIVDKIEELSGVTISMDEALKNVSVTTTTDFSCECRGMLQYFSNLYGGKTIINRTGMMEYSPYTTCAGSCIKEMNVLSKPLLLTSKQVKEMRCAICSADCSKHTVMQETIGGWAKQSSQVLRHRTDEIDFDFREKILLAICADVDNGYGEKKPGSGAIYYFEMSTSKGVPYLSVRYGVARGYKMDVWLQYVPLESDEKYPYNTYGDVCDVKNPIGAPSHDRIYKYFQNQKMYTVDVRGNPARDVGDLTTMELYDTQSKTTVEKNVVILKSNLKFDGTFKEELTVRVIENDVFNEGGNQA